MKSGVQHVLANDIGSCRLQRYVTWTESTHVICNEDG